MTEDKIAQLAYEQRKHTLAMDDHRYHDAAPPSATVPSLPLPSDSARLADLEASLKAQAPTPWLTHTLVALNILVFCITAYLADHLLRMPAEHLLRWGGNAASEVQKGDLWRLLSATFLHGGAFHLFFNMLGLYSAGILVERIYGRRPYALIYLGSGFIGSAASLHYAAQNAVSVGASGAIFGVTAALLIGIFQHRAKLPETFSRPIMTNMGLFIIAALINGFSHSGIDNAAHVGGLLAGAVLAWLLPERFAASEQPGDPFPKLLQGGALALSVALILALSAPTAAVDQLKRIESQENLVRAFKGFDAAMAKIAAEEAALKTGQITLREADDRSRSILAPMMRAVVNDFSLTDIPPSDPRRPLYLTTRRLSELLLESFEMASVYRPGDNTPHPAEPVRMAEIEREIKDVTLRLQDLMQRLSNKDKAPASGER